MSKKNVAIIGYGGMGGWHAKHLLESDCANLIGIFDIKESRQELARERGIRAYDSLEQLLADPAVDIVTIATPNDVHKELAIKAMAAGKNVISEKPVTLCSSDLQEMFDASEKYSRLFVVHQNRRWDADFLAMKQIFESGLLGEVFNIESRVHGPRGIPGDWRHLKAHGGGMMLDWGVHIIDQMLQMIPGRIKSVYCTTTNVTNGEVDDGFTLVLQWENGPRTLLEVGTSNFVELPRWYVQGVNGTAVINDWHLNGKIVRITNWEKNDAIPIKTAAGLTKTMAPRTDETIATEELPIVHSDIKDFYRNVMDAISGKAEQKIKHHELMRVMKVMEAAFRSAASGQVVDFE